MQRCKIAPLPTSARQAAGPDCVRRCLTCRGRPRQDHDRSPHPLQPRCPCRSGGDPRPRHPRLARLAAVALDPVLPASRIQLRRISMRHPWLLSTVAAVAFVALTAFSPPSSGEAPCSAAGVGGLDSAAAVPPDPCREGYAHASGYLAYLQARLALTEDQQPLWGKWQQKLEAAALAEQSNCLADHARFGSKPNALQREDAFLRSVSARLEAVKAARPEL